MVCCVLYAFKYKTESYLLALNLTNCLYNDSPYYSIVLSKNSKSNWIISNLFQKKIRSFSFLKKSIL